MFDFLFKEVSMPIWAWMFSIIIIVLMSRYMATHGH